MRNDTGISVPAACGPITATMQRNALDVVTDAEQYAARRSLRQLAWITLMAARGNRVDQHQLNKMAEEMAR